MLDAKFQCTCFADVRNFDYGKEARRLRLFWARAFTAQFMGSNYLHLIVFHTAEYWAHLKSHFMTFGLFSTTGVERRHVSLGRPAHDKSFKLHDVGRKRKNGEDREHEVLLDLENRVSYLTLRELLMADWVELNTLCLTCDTWRRDCLCAVPRWCRHQHHTAGKNKRRKLNPMFDCEAGGTPVMGETVGRDRDEAEQYEEQPDVDGDFCQAQYW